MLLTFKHYLKGNNSIWNMSYPTSTCF